MNVTAQCTKAVSSSVEWVDEGDFFSLKRVSNLTEIGSVFVERVTKYGHVLSEQARKILLRDNVSVSTHCYKFCILKGSILSSRKRNMNNVLNKGGFNFGFRLPDASAVRLFLKSICVCDMKAMGFNTIVLTRLMQVRGGVSCRIVIHKRGDSVTVGTFIEEKSDRWLKNTGFLFVE